LEQGCSATGLQRAEQQHAAAGEQAPARKRGAGTQVQRGGRSTAGGKRWRTDGGAAGREDRAAAGGAASCGGRVRRRAAVGARRQRRRAELGPVGLPFFLTFALQFP